MKKLLCRKIIGRPKEMLLRDIASAGLNVGSPGATRGMKSKNVLEPQRGSTKKVQEVKFENNQVVQDAQPCYCCINVHFVPQCKLARDGDLPAGRQVVVLSLA